MYIFQLIKGYKFSSAGREDSDVLMLGDGRPFYLQLINPKRTIATKDQLEILSEEIIKKSAGKISVLDLQIVSKDSTRILKDSAATKSKSYRCQIETDRPVDIECVDKINVIRDLKVLQKNPTRVPRCFITNYPGVLI